MYNELISLSLNEAEKILKNKGEQYIVKYVNTFKLDNYDTFSVVRVEKENNLTVLYVCKFLCNIDNKKE